MKVDCFQPILNIKTRTGLLDTGEVSVTEDLGFGIVGAEALEKLYHGLFLGWGSGIGWTAVGIKAALVADADAVGVVMLGMGAGHLLGTARIDGAVLGDVVVVADGFETSGEVTGFQVFYREVLGHTGCRAMQYD